MYEEDPIVKTIEFLEKSIFKINNLVQLIIVVSSSLIVFELVTCFSIIIFVVVHYLLSGENKTPYCNLQVQ